MIPYQVAINHDFVGREAERESIQDALSQPGAKIITVYGRRRVGKTELLEQTFRKRNILKFEGQDKLTQPQQMAFVMQQLADYLEEPLLRKVAIDNWVDVFKYVANYTREGIWTIYLEELQWLAGYQDVLVSALKYVWDNFFRHNKNLVLILCGSSPSFMINEVIKSRALHNRSQYEIPLQELSLVSAYQVLAMHSKQEVLDIYLTLGGMPEYLLRFRNKQSAYITLCKSSFKPGAFFWAEIVRIFSSSLGNNKVYWSIIEYLSKRKFATRSELSKHVKLKTGGGLTDILRDLIICGFIQKYTPYNLSKNSKTARYCIADAYMQFYFKFIGPISEDVEQGNFRREPTSALNLQDYHQWLGYAFERFCRKYHRVIASILGFSAVKYRSGVYFSRKAAEYQKGYQVDLLFDRDDKVVTICELRYHKTELSASMVDSFAKKLDRIEGIEKKTIQKVVISNQPPSKALLQRAYFDRFITLDELFLEAHW